MSGVEGLGPLQARRYQRAGKTDKTKMLDELCSLTGWTRRHARRALAKAPGPLAEGSVVEVAEGVVFVGAAHRGGGHRCFPAGG